MGTPSGRGTVSGNRYILLAGGTQDGTGVQSSTPQRQSVTIGEQGSKTKNVQGGKRTLDERSPGVHDQPEKVGRRRMTKDDGRNATGEGDGNGSHEEEQEDQDMESSEEDETITNVTAASGEKRSSNEEPVGAERSQERQEGRHRDRRVDEFMLGEIFHRIEVKFAKDMTDLVKKLPVEVKGQVQDSMSIMLEGLKGMMTGISDAVASEGYERRRDDADMVAKIEELRQEVKEVKRVADNWAGEESVAKVKESEKEMERKVRAAESQLKYLDIDIGYSTEDRRDMVRQVVNVLRGDTFPEDRHRYDRIMRKTRIVLLGKKTEVRRDRGRVMNTVPVLLELQNSQDRDELEMLLRKAGYFAAFHWPSEIKEFVGKIREGLVDEGYGESHFIRIRPEEKGGEVLIRADVRLKNGGKFQTKGFWKCPPAEKAFWGMITGMYAPLSSAQMRR
jgi:hypothetical protein